MSVHTKSVAALLQIVSDTLVDENLPVTPEYQTALLNSWAADYEDLPPRNKLETKMFDTIQYVLDTHFEKTTRRLPISV